ncbi:VOC family protein [Gymnodinialimonas sp. 57CJ19]|uniref:VOC family protein n=1 Tax=Gymnodinialimonas sp. 57CJ19 TaxID=3138498 RepID=UPI00313428E9
MSQSRRAISFVATAMPDLAEAFYSDTLGLTLTEKSPYALAFADGDAVLRVQIVQTFTPAPYTSHGWEVPDIAQEVADLTSKGVAFERFEPLNHDAMGVWTTPDGHRIAWFKDPDGNILSLTQRA